MKISTFSTSEITSKILHPSQLKTHQSILHFLPGFDTITYGFCLQQCITETVLGALVGVSAVISTFFLLKNTNFFGEITIECQKPVNTRNPTRPKFFGFSDV